MGGTIRVRRDVAGDDDLVVRFDGEQPIPFMTDGVITTDIVGNVTGNVTGTLTSTIAPRLNYLADPSPPGDCTINHPTGRASVALGATACVITNSLVTTATMCFISPLLNDATLVTWKAVCTANTITVTGSAAATADWPFYFLLVQQVTP